MSELNSLKENLKELDRKFQKKLSDKLESRLFYSASVSNENQEIASTSKHASTDYSAIIKTRKKISSRVSLLILLFITVASLGGAYAFYTLKYEFEDGLFCCATGFKLKNIFNLQ